MAFLSMAALQVAAAPAMAQNIGDVGADSRGNIYTFVRDRTGRGVWMKGRTIPEPTTERRILDDGVEGFMTPHVTELGVPVCNQPPKTHRGKH